MTTASTTQIPYGQTFGDQEARGYEEGFVPAIGSPFGTALVAAAALRKGERVLDVACGTGIVSRLAADQVAPDGSVSGLDLSPAMLSVARSVAQSSGRSIRFYESSAEAMPLPDGSFDVVFCQLGLMFMQDRRAAAREMRRVLVPGGRVLVSTARPNAVFDAMDKGIARHIGTEPAGFVRQVFSLPDPAALASLLRDAGFRDVESRVERKTAQVPPPRDFLWGYIGVTPLAATMAVSSPEQRAALERDVVAAWKPFTTENGMRFEQEVAVVIGWK